MEGWCCWFETGLVLAEGDLPANSISKVQDSSQEIQIKRLLCSEGRDSSFTIKVSMVGGYLCPMSSGQERRWLSFIRPAGDILEQNCELCWAGAYRLPYLRMTRDLSHGKELKIWFSQELVAAMQIPLLAPGNIQGPETYVCGHCGKVFNQPNPLKVHLMFLGEKTLCGKGHGTIMQENSPYTEKPCLISQLDNQMDHNMNSLAKKCILPRKTASAFKPAKHSITNDLTTSQNYKPSSIVQETSEYKREKVSKICQPATNMEASVSKSPSMDYVTHKPKGHHNIKEHGIATGHACQYCGKVYSRRYGLKIHVRTHTGYKPLECRFCLRSFSDPSNLNKHVRLHSEMDTPYKCSLCGKVLVRRRDLDRHLKSRHPGHLT